MIEIKIRILVLTRGQFQAIKDDLIEFKDLIGDQPIASLNPLTQGQAKILATAAHAKLKEIRSKPTPPLDIEKCAEWLNSSNFHRRPLYVMAATLHWVTSSEEDTFGMQHGDIISALIDREIRRLNGVSLVKGWDRDALCQFLAISTAAGGLPIHLIRKLTEGTICIVEDSFNSVWKKLSSTPWWDHERGCLSPIQPDPIGAAFYEKVLANVPNEISTEWHNTLLSEATL